MCVYKHVRVCVYICVCVPYIKAKSILLIGPLMDFNGKKPHQHLGFWLCGEFIMVESANET